MTSNSLSRILTLADVMAHIKAADLPERRRGEMLSALNSLARVLGRSLDAVPAQPQVLGRLMAQVAPAAHGISQGRWGNVRSLVGKALEMVTPLMPARQHLPLDPGWAALLERVQPAQRRAALSSGLRWLGGRGAHPATVRAEDLDALRTAIAEESLRTRPHEVWGGFVLAWNHARATVPGWPDMVLEKPDRRRRVTLGWDAFPPGLRIDTEAWLARQAGHDVMDEDGPPRPLRPASIESYRYLVRSVASGAVAEGIDPASLAGLADLVRLPVFKAALKAQWRRGGQRPSSSLSKTASVLISIARYWARLPEAELKALRDAARKVEPGKRRGLTEKNLARLRPFEDPGAVHALLNLPFALRREVERGALPERRAALHAQVAVALAVLLIAPLRLQNLRSLHLDRHLVRHGQRLHIVIPSGEVKNGIDLEFEVEPETRTLIDWYVREHLPVLDRAGTRLLFPGTTGKAKGACGLRVPLMAAIRRKTGLTLNPHLVRHLAAKLYLDRNPGDYETVRRLLGHSSIETTVRFYAGFETKAATRHYQSVVTGLRRSGDPA